MKRKHLVGDCVRIALIGVIVLCFAGVIHGKIEQEKELERREVVYQEHMARIEQRREELSRMTPEEKFKDFVYGVDEKGIVGDIRSNENEIYIYIGVKETDNAIAAAKGLMNTFLMCAREEGIEKKLYIVGINEDIELAWIIDEDGNLIEGYVEKVIALDEYM